MANTFGGITKQADAFAITANAYDKAAEEAERASDNANSIADNDGYVDAGYAHQNARDAHDEAARLAPSENKAQYHTHKADEHHQKYLDLDSKEDYRRNG